MEPAHKETKEGIAFATENMAPFADGKSQSNTDLEKNVYNMALQMTDMRTTSDNDKSAVICQYEDASAEVKQADEGQPEIDLNKQPMNVSPSAPDGGWGWIVVCCAFCVTAIVGGSYTAFSILYMELTVAFDATKAVAGWIGSIYMAIGQFLGMYETYGL